MSELGEADIAQQNAVATQGSSTAEIWSWVFCSDAVASCFVKDVLDMRESGVKDAEFFWLGRVPCRTVYIVGTLVGVQMQEQRTIYTLDDGSAVIDCIKRHSMNMSSSPTRSRTQSSFESTTSTYYYRPPPFSAPPKPVAQVGKSVCVVGRIAKHFDTRKIMIDDIVPSTSANDEPKHWLAVLDLHSSYYCARDLPPFIVPAPTARRIERTNSPKSQAHTHSPTAESSRKRAKIPDSDASPRSSMHVPTQTSVASSVPSSPARSTASAASSPAKQGQSPPRLRHPSRLHTRDLTANTFRIYVKHYMDNAPAPTTHSRAASASSSRSPSPCPRQRSGKGRADVLPVPDNSDASEGPMKAPRYESARLRDIRIGLRGDATPRASQRYKHASHIDDLEDGEHTPRAPRSPSLLNAAHPPTTTADDGEDVDDMDCPRGTYGVTLSHLRRVHELAYLAQRVVDTESRRRAREERKRGEGKRGEGGSTQDRQRAREREKEERGSKAKRLFRFAIRQLYEEGSIVLWDGPMRPLPPSEDDTSLGLDALWRASASTSSVATSNASVASSVASGWDGEDALGELSDPPLDEEAYISLMPAYFVTVVEKTIRSIMNTAASQKENPEREKQRNHSRAAVSLEPPKAPFGPTSTDILAWLRRDERWARVGEWTVKEALEWGRNEGRVWCVGRERWEVCE